ncbi:MAG: acyl-CoA dehydratase activase-related protein, partial [Desulfotomaculales bacterium]
AEPLLPVSVGGHGRESVGEFVLARQEGVDGVIHLFPFTCMPEIIAQGILVPLAERLEMPFLSLAVNEQTGTAGLQTRLEAFLDVLQARREEKIHVFGGDACGLLSGY